MKEQKLQATASGYLEEPTGGVQRQRPLRSGQVGQCFGWAETGICGYGKGCRFTHRPADRGSSAGQGRGWGRGGGGRGWGGGLQSGNARVVPPDTTNTQLGRGPAIAWDRDLTSLSRDQDRTKGIRGCPGSLRECIRQRILGTSRGTWRD